MAPRGTSQPPSVMQADACDASNLRGDTISSDSQLEHADEQLLQRFMRGFRGYSRRAVHALPCRTSFIDARSTCLRSDTSVFRPVHHSSSGHCLTSAHLSA
eukprot:1735316-Pleurochrysis_carterae.AAC.1